jgi:hypothetical protein
MVAGSRAARLILVGANPLAAETSCAAVLANGAEDNDGSPT